MSGIRLPSNFYYKILFSIVYSFAKLKPFGPKFSMLSALGKYFGEFNLKCFRNFSNWELEKKKKKDILSMFRGACSYVWIGVCLSV